MGLGLSACPGTGMGAQGAIELEEFEPSGTECKTTTASEKYNDLNEKIIVGVSLSSLEESVTTGTASSATTGQVYRNATCHGSTASVNAISTASSSYPNAWKMEFDTITELNSLDDCNNGGTGDCAAPDSCAGDYGAKLANIPDTKSCEDYDNDISLGFRWADSGAKPMAPPTSECVSGFAPFRLIPMTIQDSDGDGLVAATLYAHQMSGAGVMTGRSWIESIDLVEAAPGVNLRAIKPFYAHQFDGADHLLNASTIGVAITGEHSFGQGQLSGNAHFTVDEVDPALLEDLQVDIGWSCDSALPTVGRPQGYQLSLGQVGCSGMGSQKFTLRHFEQSETFQLEVYGSPNLGRVWPAVSTPQGPGFRVEEGELKVEGALLSAGPQQAVVLLSTISLQGLPICSAGTYTFQAE